MNPSSPRSGHSPAPTALLLPLLLATLLAACGVASPGRRGSDAAPEATSGFVLPAWAQTARFNRPLEVLDTRSAIGRLDSVPKTLTLRDVALVHGHLCDGLVTAWVELGAALRRLFPEGIIDRTDVRVVSKNGPCWADAAGWLTGARVNHGTLVLDNAVGDGFIVQRMSTGEAVRVRLRTGTYPRGLAALEDSIRARRARGEDVADADIRRFETGAATFSRRLLGTPPSEAIVLDPLPAFVFPTTSPNLIAPRSDIINRDRPSAPVHARR